MPPPLSSVAPRSATSGTIASIRARLLAGEFSPAELIESVLARIEREDPILRAWVYLDRDAALAAAKAVDVAAQPLAGIPFGVKDVFDVRGMPTRYGTPYMPGPPATLDAWCVAAMRAAGAIPLGKLATTAFAFKDPSATRNPWNLGRTPGGSSAGSGAAVGARQVPFAFGTQTGGSTLRPAAYNGACGLMPTIGKIPTAGMSALAPTYDHVGIICRTAADATTLLGIFDPSVEDAIAPRPLRIGYARDFQRMAIEPEVEAVLDGALAALATAGAEVTEIAMPTSLIEADGRWETILAYESSANLSAALNGYGVSPKLSQALAQGAKIDYRAYREVQLLRKSIIADVQHLYDDLDVIVLATAGLVPDPSTTGSGQLAVLRPWTSMGMPAVSIPAGLTPDGMPAGLQFVGAYDRDALVLAAARWAEEALAFQNPGPQHFMQSL